MGAEDVKVGDVIGGREVLRAPRLSDRNLWCAATRCVTCGREGLSRLDVLRRSPGGGCRSCAGKARAARERKVSPLAVGDTRGAWRVEEVLPDPPTRVRVRCTLCGESERVVEAGSMVNGYVGKRCAACSLRDRSRFMGGARSGL